MDKIEKFIDKISYRGRRKKRLQIFDGEYKKYMAMPENEFTMEFIEVSAMYEHKKLMLTMVFITFITSVIMDLWKFVFDVLMNILILDGGGNHVFTQVAEFLAWFIIIFSIIIISLLIFNLSKNLYLLSKKKFFLEELKAMRKQNNG